VKSNIRKKITLEEYRGIKRMKSYSSIVFIGLWLITKNLNAATFPGPLVEPEWLKNNLHNVLILDIRYDLKSFTSEPKYINDIRAGKTRLVKVGGHIPGSVLINFMKTRKNIRINGKLIKYMYQNKDTFQSYMQSRGVNRDSRIVITSKGQNSSDMSAAASLYWQLKYYGHKDVAILNGGVAQWILSGNKISTKPEKVKKGNWVASTERKEILATSEQVDQMRIDKKTQLIDNRSLGQYLGTWKQPYVSSKGHIPGAKVFPNELMTQSRLPARFLEKEKLAKLFKTLGIDTNRNSVTYCNSGHLASGGWFILSEIMGSKNVRMFDGSMHQWTLEKRPVRELVME
jgi:thiosulfate/3-mercaptopyruvate sulfurtransferase